MNYTSIPFMLILGLILGMLAMLALGHPVHVHFTPTSASWLNQVDIWVGLWNHAGRGSAGPSILQPLDPSAS